MKEYMNNTDYFQHKKDIYLQYYDKFLQIFHVSLWHYWSLLFGFDAVKFDEQVIKPSDEMSTMQQIAKDYGEDAVILINTLLEG